MDINASCCAAAWPEGSIHAVKPLAATDIEKTCHVLREKRRNKTVSFKELKAWQKLFLVYGIFMVMGISDEDLIETFFFFIAEKTEFNREKAFSVF